MYQHEAFITFFIAVFAGKRRGMALKKIIAIYLKSLTFGEQTTDCFRS
jgi:hypothetical protein